MISLLVQVLDINRVQCVYHTVQALHLFDKPVMLL